MHILIIYIIYYVIKEKILNKEKKINKSARITV